LALNIGFKEAEQFDSCRPTVPYISGNIQVYANKDCSEIYLRESKLIDSGMHLTDDGTKGWDSLLV